MFGFSLRVKLEWVVRGGGRVDKQKKQLKKLFFLHIHPPPNFPSHLWDNELG